jgi:hypothetical protein
MRTRLLVWAPLTLLTAIVVACSSSSDRSGFGDDADAGGDTSGSSGGFIDPDSGSACAGLECKIAKDCNGSSTTLRGKVYDPAGSNALYNVQVYIPSGQNPEALPPLPDSTQDGIVCETCSSTVLSPLRATLTDSSGEFTLEDVPVDKEVPVVIQVGKWRRLFKLDASKKCAENKVPDRSVKLPRNGSEGDMPQIAVTGGDYDALECLLRGIGIDDSEFMMGHETGGHVHVFKGYFSQSGMGMGPPAQDFWTDAEQLKKYDMLLLSCEGDEHNENKGDKSAVYDYLNAGGKAFATHYHYTWFKNSPADEFKNVAAWGGGFGGSSTFDVNQSFPKGAEFAKWLQATGASSQLGKIQLSGATDSLKAINDPALGWIQDSQDPAHAKYFSFNTPMSAPAEQQCGRAVFSDVHITDKAGPTSIGACGISSGGLNAQQKALEFLFFDLSSCVSDDTKEPEPPK